MFGVWSIYLPLRGYPELISLNPRNTPIPRYYRLSVITGTNCPHDKKSVGMCVIKREINRIIMYECRCDERLKDKPERSTRLVYTGFRGGLEHLKIETRLIDERFPSVMGECVI